VASKSGSVSSGVISGMTLSRSDRDATLDGARLPIAGVKDVMMDLANTGSAPRVAVQRAR
jgi:hypothetical protein